MEENKGENNEELTPLDAFKNSIYGLPETLITQEEKELLIKHGSVYFSFMDFICEKQEISPEEAEKRYNKFSSEFLADAYEKAKIESLRKFAEYNEYEDPDGLVSAFVEMQSTLDKLNTTEEIEVDNGEFDTEN